MSKRLIIAEKPSVGRDIANVLNCKERHVGFITGDNDIVTWAVGHLVGLCYPDEIDENYKNWKIGDLPILPDPFRLKVLESGEKQYEIVQKLMNDSEVDRIVCATDAGREGELIFRYIYQMAGCSKPVERLWISSLTYSAIKKGFENLKPASEYDNLYESARCRSEADWLIGMNGSRAYGIENDMKRLSVGRVLSPTLSILVQRELEIRKFVPKTYCETIAVFDGYTGRMINTKKAGSKDWSRFPMKQKGELVEYVGKHYSTGKVISCEYKEDRQPAPQLYDLTSLQRDANRKYGMSSKWTLDTAQSLYEKHKAITYPRTDSRYLSSDIKSTLSKRLENIHMNELKPYVNKALSSDKELFGRYINNHGVTDHHAIIPTGEAKDTGNWSEAEKHIYDLIVRRFIAMFLNDRTVIHQTVKIKIGDQLFRSQGEKITESGWSEVDTSRDSNATSLPDFKEGGQVNVFSMRVRIGETKPPAPHTEASLLLAMEHAGKIVSEDSDDDKETEFGIGTPATRAAIIEKIIEKEMAVRRGKSLIPTEYGIKLIGILPETLQSPKMTGEWEAKLARISKGKESSEAFMEGIRKLTRDVIHYAVDQGDTGIKNSNSVGPCPLCGSPVREYEYSYYCANKNCGFRKIIKVKAGFHPTLNSITMRELLENKTAVTEKGTFRLIENSPYIAFDYAPKPVPDYEALHSLIEEYGLSPINKVPHGGALWLQGNRQDELMQDFLKDCRETGCRFDFTKDSSALGHKSGWYHKVDPEYKDAFDKVSWDKTKEDDSDIEVIEVFPEESDDPVLDLVEKSGFEYIDKRQSGGSLWIIAGEKEALDLIAQCKKLGVTFSFTAKGGRTSKKRPAWYSINKNAPSWFKKN